jgi:hypothetical protein
MFYKKKFAIFPTLSEAMGWVHGVILEERKWLKLSASNKNLKSFLYAIK